jgi:hypothetical protein
MLPVFEGVEVFTATLAAEREKLGRRASQFIADNPGLEIVDKDVSQSSDRTHHCLTLMLYWRRRSE